MKNKLVGIYKVENECDIRNGRVASVGAKVNPVVSVGIREKGEEILSYLDIAPVPFCIAYMDVAAGGLGSRIQILEAIN